MFYFDKVTNLRFWCKICQVPSLDDSHTESFKVNILVLCLSESRTERLRTSDFCVCFKLVTKSDLLLQDPVTYLCNVLGIPRD